jgi:hypothetical protein
VDAIVRDISDARLAFFVEANLLLGNVQVEVTVSFAKEMHNCFVGETLLFLCFRTNSLFISVGLVSSLLF